MAKFNLLSGHDAAHASLGCPCCTGMGVNRWTFKVIGDRYVCGGKRTPKNLDLETISR